MRGFRLILLFLSFLTISGITSAQQDYLKSVSIDRDTIIVGDRVTYTVGISGSGQFTLKYPALLDTLQGGIQVLGKPVIDSVIKKDTRDYKLKIYLSAYDSGLHVIPVLPLLVQTPRGIDTITFEERQFFVKLVPRNSTINDIKDIKPPISEPIRLSEIATWTGLGLLLAAFIALLVLYLKRRKQNKPFLNLFKPLEPPHVVALRELQQLEIDKQWETENYKMFYTRLVDILRIYLEGRFGIHAPEQTSSEILSELSKIDFDLSKFTDDIRELLFTSDLVKFAKHVPHFDENHRYLLFTIDFVNATKPVEALLDQPNKGTTGSGVDSTLSNQSETGSVC